MASKTLTQTFKVTIVRKFQQHYLRAVQMVFGDAVKVSCKVSKCSRYAKIKLTYDIKDGAKLFYLGTTYMQYKWK